MYAIQRVKVDTACGDPDCKGWVHMDSPFEIEKCDECGKYKTDDEARVAHKEDCGCLWPDIDYIDACRAWLERLREHPDTRPQMIKALEDIFENRGEDFLSKFTGDRVYDLIDCMSRSNDYAGQNISPSTNSELRMKLRDLVSEMKQKLLNEELKLKDFGDSESLVNVFPKRDLSANEELQAFVRNAVDDSDLDSIVLSAIRDFEQFLLHEQDYKKKIEFLVSVWGIDETRRRLADNARQ